jgi:shikimate kinase
MGAGKSTVGPLLASLLDWDFQETDVLIEKRVRLPIPEIFRTRGEPFFREEELAVVSSIAGLTRVVIAAGGGAFAEPRTRDTLKKGSTTVWLKAPFETLLARIGDPGSRPLARDRERMLSLWTEREPSYRSADLVVETLDVAPEGVARRIAESVFGDPPGR